MQDERAGRTIQTTALVHEAWLRLVDVANVDWQHRAHFFAVSATMMRHILLDRARRRVASKRGGGLARVNLDEIPDVSSGKARELIGLDDALKAIDARKARVIELRFFGGVERGRDGRGAEDFSGYGDARLETGAGLAADGAERGGLKACPRSRIYWEARRTMTAVFAAQIHLDSDGVAWIAGTKVKVIEVVLDKLAYGWSPEEIHFQHPHLSLAQIYGALAWYYENQPRLDAEIGNRLENADTLALQASDPEFRRRLADLKRSL